MSKQERELPPGKVMSVQGNARTCLPRDHCRIFTAATFCHVKHLISSLLQQAETVPSFRPAQGTVQLYNPAGCLLSAGCAGGAEVRPERGERPQAAEIGGSEQTPGGALHHRGLREGLAGAKSQATPGQAPSSSQARRYQQLPTGQRRRPHSQDPTSPGTPSSSKVLTPPPVLTALRGGDAAQPPRRAASASARGGRPAALRGAPQRPLQEGRKRRQPRRAPRVRERATPAAPEDRAARSLGEGRSNFHKAVLFIHCKPQKTMLLLVPPC